MNSYHRELQDTMYLSHVILNLHEKEKLSFDQIMDLFSSYSNHYYSGNIVRNAHSALIKMNAIKLSSKPGLDDSKNAYEITQIGKERLKLEKEIFNMLSI